MKRLAVAAVLLLAACASALLILGRGGPPLEPWHTEDLDLDFTAQKADRVRSFDDYLRLEDALFAELDEKIYDVIGSGPAYALVRYSTGSAADPQDWAPNWNRSFEFSTDDPVGGVLLLHGMSDSPYSLRALGKALNERGYWVLGPRMPGHGTAPSGLKSVTWRDMAAAVRLAADRLANRAAGKPIHIVGYSTGAALALDLALDAQEDSAAPQPASLVLISPAIGVHPLAALAVWKARLSALPGLEGLAWLDVQPEFDPFKYNSFATNAGAQVFSLTRSVTVRLAARAKAEPNAVLPPTLVFKSTVDATVSTDAVVDNLLGRLAPHRHELVLFDINRAAAKSQLLISDPAPLTDRLLADTALPFTLTLVTNEAPESARVLARRKPPHSAAMESEPLGLRWPNGVISLSHVALPFPPDDPLYGARPPGKRDVIFLGQMAIRGERGLLRIPSDWLMRLRHNPFHSYLEDRALSWIDGAGD
jgi:alpha-beta hydrolase superfamily lysophospholipase